MYLEFFDMSDSPFPTVAVSENYFGFHGANQALESLESAMQRQAGPCLIIGPAGTGKTILLDRLKSHYQRQRLTVCLSSTRLCTRRSLLQSFLFEVGLDYHAKDEGELRLSLTEFLRTSPSSENGLVLLVDEAHTLPLHLLDELRVLTNIVRSGKSLLQLVMAGSSRLEENLSEPSMDSFNQRIACRAYLSSVGREELEQYVRFQLQRVGCSDTSLFTHNAIKSIHIATNGIPRLVNQLAEFALVCAAEKKERQIDGDLIQWAWSTMQQIPIVTETRTQSADLSSGSVVANEQKTSTDIIEFGELDDDFGCNTDTKSLETVSQGQSSAGFEDNAIHQAATFSPATVSDSVAPIDSSVSESTVSESAEDCNSKERPAVITFAFEQDIQKPKVPQEIQAAEEATEESKEQLESRADSLQAEHRIEVTSQSETEFILEDQSLCESEADSDCQEVESMAMESEIVIDTNATFDRIQNTMDVVSNALSSLDDDWLTVEQVLAEAELDAVVRPVVSDPQKSFSALAGDKQKGPQIRATVDPKDVFDDHLFNDTEVIDDTQWGQFLQPENETSHPDELIEKVQVLEAGLEEIEQQVATQLRIDAEQAWAAEPHFEIPSPKSDIVDDDRRIIHQSIEGISISHEPHVNVNPPVARRKDLRALLTALRGY